MVIEGLTAPGDPPLARVCPVLNRLARVGVTGRMESGADGALLWRMFSPPLRAFPVSPPLGYLAALGLGLGPDPARTWARMEFTHLMQHRDRLIFAPSERVNVSVLERQQLADAMVEVLEEAGWTVHAPLEHGSIVISTPQVMEGVATPLERLDGASLQDHHPQGADGLALLSLVTHGQMLLARHLVNRKRMQSGALPLNTPWIWGVGNGAGCQSGWLTHQGLCWSGDVVASGVAVAAGFSGLLLGLQEDAVGLRRLVDAVLAAESVAGLMVLPYPARLARARGHEERLRWLSLMDAELLAPLTKVLAATDGRLVVVGEGPESAWVMAQEKKLVARPWFWMNQSMGQGRLLDPDTLRKQWLE